MCWAGRWKRKKKNRLGEVETNAIFFFFCVLEIWNYIFLRCYSACNDLLLVVDWVRDVFVGGL